MTRWRSDSFFPAATSILFVAAIFLGVLAANYGRHWEWMTLAAKTLLALGFLSLGAWFLHAFTQCDPVVVHRQQDAEQRASMFRFAYLFSLFSFALLVLPFTAMLRTHETTPDAGPIRLLRACVMPAARPASGVVGPVEFCPQPMPATGTVIYPWLVSVGGVVAQPCDPNGYRCWADQPASASVAPSAQAASAGPAASAALPASDTPPASAASSPHLPPMFTVSGGFVVPFYVVVFAYIGGIVNLTRRLPEYQKRSACDYVSTPAEPKLLTIEAREFVVFQLMQLLSSPFVAMVAYYALEPKSIASAVGLAFISGFSTEAVLLMIRGVVNGVRPETTKPAAATAPSLRVKVEQAGKAAPKARVELRRSENDTIVLRTAETDDLGEVEFRALEAGTLWVRATASGGGAPSAPRRIELKAGQAESIVLTLV